MRVRVRVRVRVRLRVSVRVGYWVFRVFHPEDFWTRSVKRKEVTAQAGRGGAPP